MKISNEAQSIIAVGILIFLIAIGMGGCTYLCNRSEALVNQSKQEQPK